MKRKVVKHGPSTFIISLPSKWVKENNIEKGSELDIITEANKVIISTEQEKKRLETTVDLSNLDRTSIMYIIRSFYRLGYDIVNVKFENTTTHYQRTGEELNVLSVIHTEVNRLIGYEIIQERERSCIIKDLQGSTDQEFESILRRVFFLIIDTSNDFINGIKTNDKQLLKTIENKHDTITKFVSYCLRMLNKQNRDGKTCYFYHIIASLDRITDIMKYAARDAMSFDFQTSPKSVKILESVIKGLKDYNGLFYDYSSKRIIEINNERYKTEKMLKSLPNNINIKEAMMVSMVFQILEILLDLIEARTALEY